MVVVGAVLGAVLGAVQGAVLGAVLGAFIGALPMNEQPDGWLTALRAPYPAHARSRTRPSLGGAHGSFWCEGKKDVLSRRRK